MLDHVTLGNMTRILISSFALSLWATGEPTWKSELTTAAPGPHPAITPQALDLQISWKGMVDSGRIHLDFAPRGANKPGRLVVKTTSDSVGAASKLFPYHSDFWSEINPRTLEPIFFHSNEVDRKEAIDTTVHYGSGSAKTREIARDLKTGKTTTSHKIFRHTPVHDIFSAMLHVRSQALNHGDQVALVVMPFNTPYLLRAKVLGRENHNGRRAIKLSVGMRKIDRDTLELKNYKKLKRDATLWLSDDDDRIPLEFRAAVFIGDVRATLTQQLKR